MLSPGPLNAILPTVLIGFGLVSVLSAIVLVGLFTGEKISKKILRRFFDGGQNARSLQVKNACQNATPW
jgi:hypothetical protein